MPRTDTSRRRRGHAGRTDRTAPATATDTDLEDLRRVAFGAAYRMLGSVTEAEDVAQEAMVRVAPVGVVDAAVLNPAAYTTTVATRIALDVLRSARVRRESYVGEWVPEPLVGDVVAAGSAGREGAAHAELADDLSTAFLVLLEELTPAERAAFLLHDVFGYPHRESAQVIGTTELAARQLASRARRRVAARRHETPDERAGRPDPHAAELVRRFIAATEEGDVEALVELLADDVSLTGDGGGKVPVGLAVSRPVSGNVAVARLLSGFARRGAPARLEAAVVNGGPGMIAYADDAVGGGVIGAYSLQVTGGLVTQIHGVINPEKLQHLAPLADLDAVAAVIRAAGPRRRPPRAPDAPPSPGA
ncbi:RNA polymerase sigma factor SigJ [Isoptericola sp. F-RaC21]|uniref:RNA polymerase sigma factor SigJ n=1 Tax=Isoptericola sp. F-RaC21 TaxID=3141452 RepID=UPI00315C1D74